MTPNDEVYAEGGGGLPISGGGDLPPAPAKTRRMPVKSEMLAAAAAALGIAPADGFSGGGLSQTLKELAVFCGAAESPADIRARTIGEVLRFIAENGQPIVNPAPEGTINITANGTHDVTKFASAEVKVPEPVVSQLTIQNDSSTTMSFLGSLEIKDGYVCTKNTEVNVSAGYSNTVGVGRTKVGTTTTFSAIFRLRINDATKTAEDFDFKYDGTTAVTWYFMLNNGSQSFYYGLCYIQASNLKKSLVISDK